MKTRLIKLALGAAATLCMAVPGFSSALQFSGSPPNAGLVVVNSASGQVTTLTGVPFSDLIYQGTDYSLDMTNFSLSGSTLTLSGEVFNSANTTALAGLGTVQTLVTIQLLSALTNAAGSSTVLDISGANVSSVSVNTMLLADLAIATSDVGSLGGIGVLGTGSMYSYTVDSDILTVQENIPGVPEPVSFVICGSGLAALLLLKRRKAAETATQ